MRDIRSAMHRDRSLAGIPALGVMTRGRGVSAAADPGHDPRRMRTDRSTGRASRGPAGRALAVPAGSWARKSGPGPSTGQRSRGIVGGATADQETESSASAVSLPACDVGYAGITITAAGSVPSVDDPGSSPWSDGTIPGGYRAERCPPSARGSLHQKGRLGRRRGTQVFWWLRPPRGEAGPLTGRAKPPLIDDVGDR